MSGSRADRLGIFTNWRAFALAISVRQSSPPLKNNDFFNWHVPCIVSGTAPMVGSGKTVTRGFEMFATFTSAREAATIIAGTFLSALLLVSAATSLPIA
jgi:hypothetical protein